jgi:Glycerol uptake facilitator and related permeases (Major Intrinsic Protein Family)
MAANKANTTKKKALVKKPAVSVATTKTTVKTVPATAKKQSLGQHIETSLLSGGLWRSLGAEFIGTFLLAAVIIAGQGQPIFVLFGLVGIVLLIGSISGAHVNPAITIGAWATRRIGWLRALGYIFVQFLGAAVAYFVLSAFLGGASQPSAEQQAYGQTAAALFKAADVTALTGKEWYVFAAEVLGTTILAFAVASAFRAKETLNAAFTVGLGVFIALMIGITVTGYVSASAILNPAVALSLQAYGSGSWSYIIYGLGAVLGGVLGFLLHDLLRGKDRV